MATTSFNSKTKFGSRLFAVTQSMLDTKYERGGPCILIHSNQASLNDASEWPSVVADERLITYRCSRNWSTENIAPMS
jgi:hypothetical protein